MLTWSGLGLNLPCRQFSVHGFALGPVRGSGLMMKPQDAKCALSQGRQKTH